MVRVKQSELAGTWYPGTEERLRDEVNRCLRDGKEHAVDGPLAGIVVPHAGYAYSARAAAAGYASIANGYRRVVVVAPSHFLPFRGGAVPEFEAFATPLGQIAVDGAATDRLAAREGFAVNTDAFIGEHALEIQLPFLQGVLPQATVVPVLLGEVPPNDLGTIAAALRELEEPQTVFVISSDFIHYGARFGYVPFRASDAESVRAGLRELDLGAADCVCAGDAAAFCAYVQRTGATICGRVPIAVFLTLHAGRTRGRLLRYYTSLDVTGDFQHCVSYASIAFPR